MTPRTKIRTKTGTKTRTPARPRAAGSKVRSRSRTTYSLYYWPTIQGRGELVRLAFEEAGARYVDVARLPKKEGGGVEVLLAMLGSSQSPIKPFAPPFVKVGRLVIAHTANILQVLAPQLGLVPRDEASRIAANQLQLSVTDFMSEVHETHHPIATGLYYEDQKPEARKRARHFIEDRIPKFLGYFEAVLAANKANAKGEGKGTATGKAKGNAKPPYAVGPALTYVDLSLFQIMVGLAYAFPNAMARLEKQYPRLLALRDHVASRPRIAAYLASDRRIAPNEDDIFRRYPELDAAGAR